MPLMEQPNYPGINGRKLIETGREYDADADGDKDIPGQHDADDTDEVGS